MLYKPVSMQQSAGAEAVGAVCGGMRKYGILYQMEDIIHAYKRGYEMEQLNLFDIQ